MWGLLGEGGLHDKTSACADCTWKSAGAAGDVHHLFHPVPASKLSLRSFAQKYHMHEDDVVTLNNPADAAQSVYDCHRLDVDPDAQDDGPAPRISVRVDEEDAREAPGLPGHVLAGGNLARRMAYDSLLQRERQLAANSEASEDDQSPSDLDVARAQLRRTRELGEPEPLPPGWETMPAETLAGEPVTWYAVCPEEGASARESAVLESMGLDRTCIVKCMLHLKLRVVGLVLDKILYHDLQQVLSVASRTAIVKHLNATHKSHVKWYATTPDNGGKPFSMKVNGPSADLVLDKMTDTVETIYSALDAQGRHADHYYARKNDMLILARHLKSVIHSLERGHWEPGTEDVQAAVPKDCKRMALLYVRAIRSTARREVFSGNYIHEVFTHVSALFQKWTIERRIPLGLLSMSVLESHHMYVGKNYYWASRMASVGGRNRKHTHACSDSCSDGTCPGVGTVEFTAPAHSFAGCGPSFHMLTGMIIQSHLRHVCAKCGGVRHLCCHHGCAAPCADHVSQSGQRKSMADRPCTQRQHKFLNDPAAREVADAHDAILAQARERGETVPPTLPVPSFAMDYLPPDVVWPQREHHQHYARIHQAVVEWDQREDGERMALFVKCEQQYVEVAAVAAGEEDSWEASELEEVADAPAAPVAAPRRWVQGGPPADDHLLLPDELNGAYQSWSAGHQTKAAKERLKTLGKTMEAQIGQLQYNWENMTTKSELLAAVHGLLREVVTGRVAGVGGLV